MAKNYYEYKPNKALTKQYAEEFASKYESWPPKSIVPVFFELKESLRSEACKAFSPTTELKEKMRAEFAEKRLNDVSYEQFVCNKIKANISDVVGDIANNENYALTAYEHYIDASNKFFSILSEVNTIEVSSSGQGLDVVTKW